MARRVRVRIIQYSVSQKIPPVVF